VYTQTVALLYRYNVKLNSTECYSHVSKWIIHAHQRTYILSNSVHKDCFSHKWYM